jgi:hypothetical protein
MFLMSAVAEAALIFGEVFSGSLSLPFKLAPQSDAHRLGCIGGSPFGARRARWESTGRCATIVEARSSGSPFFISRNMHRTPVSQVALLELLDSLEAKIAAMQLRNAAPPLLPSATPEEDAAHRKTSWTSRTNGRPKPIHPFLNIEEL